MGKARWIGLLLSAAVHAALLWGAGRGSGRKADYGIAPGRSSVAVEIVEGTAQAEPRPESPPPHSPSQPDPEAMAPTLPRKLPLSRSERPVKAHSAIARGKGVAGAGREAVTLRRAGGSAAQPDYLRNPPPVYPEASREKREQGTVLVRVLVSPRGTPQAVALDRSSGFGSLDRAALEAVRRWRFRAATSGGVPVASYAIVPIVFRLASN